MTHIASGLLRAAIMANKRVDREQLIKRLPHDVEGRVHVPCPRLVQKIQLDVRGEEKVSCPIDVDVPAKKFIWNVVVVQLECQVLRMLRAIPTTVVVCIGGDSFQGW